MDNLNTVFDDLQYLLRHMNTRPDVAVSRWSNISCNDYQLALIRLISYLNSFNQTGTLSVKDRPEHIAIVDVITRSELNQLLEYNQTEKVIKYRDSILITTREAVRVFIMKNTGAV